MVDFNQPTPFDDFSSTDGFRVREVSMGSTTLLLLQLTSDDTAQPLADQSVSYQLAKCSTDEVSRGRLVRLEMLFEAFCNYFNAGGSWLEFNDIFPGFRAAVFDGLKIPGWELIDCFLDEEQCFTTVWMHLETQRVVRWVRNEFIDTEWTLQSLKESDLEEEYDELGVTDAEVTEVQSEGDSGQERPNNQRALRDLRDNNTTEGGDVQAVSG